jgi:hypothetical protein
MKVWLAFWNVFKQMLLLLPSGLMFLKGFTLYVEIGLEQSCDVGNPGEYNCIVYWNDLKCESFCSAAYPWKMKS